jgi:ligand-binding sensor domain-containing protein
VDNDGELWLGTDEGAAVIYSPENVFSGGNYDAQQILVEVGGYYQYLLETESVNAIAVDGANRKWFGTEKAGVFLMSEDGTEEIHHFTEENSPLLSNTITSIAIDKDGMVYFGTAQGVVSYRSEAIDPPSTNDDVYAFPNPVPPDYSGLIAVKGLVGNAWVKITDISGNLVYETRAEGGQAVWNGRTINGDNVHSGVYMVFITNDDGSETEVSKILFID